MRTPAGRPILARHAVHRLPDQIRVSGMPPILLESGHYGYFASGINMPAQARVAGSIRPRWLLSLRRAVEIVDPLEPD
jgi:hypothetical protein